MFWEFNHSSKKNGKFIKFKCNFTKKECRGAVVYGIGS